MHPGDLQSRKTSREKHQNVTQFSIVYVDSIGIYAYIFQHRQIVTELSQ